MQNAHLPPGAVAGRLHADSVEAYASLHEGLWDVEVLQLKTGRVLAGAAFVATPAAVIYREHWDQPVHARGCLRGDQIAFGFPAAREHAYQVAGRSAEPDSLHRLASASELDMVTGPAYRNLVLVIQRHVLRDALAAWAPELISTVLDAEACTLLCIGVPARRALELRLNQLADALLQGTLPPAWTSARLDQEILDALVGALAAVSDVSTSPVEGRRRLTADALAFARSGDFDVSVGALCQATGRSRRALELAFRQVTGVSPARYLRQARLQGAHLDLARARGERTSVTEVAMRWGFTELGRFAGTYRAWFGELPSHTLARPAHGGAGLPALRDPRAMFSL